MKTRQILPETQLDKLNKELRSRSSENITFLLGYGIGEEGAEAFWKAVRWMLMPGDRIMVHPTLTEFIKRRIKSLPSSYFGLDVGVGRGVFPIEFDTKPFNDTQGELRIKEPIEKLQEGFGPHPKVKHTKWANEDKPWAEIYNRYGNIALMTSSESHLLYDAAKRLGPGNYVSLGVWKGASCLCLAYGLQAGGHDGKVFGVDVFDIPVVKDVPEKLPQMFEELDLDVELALCKGYTNVWANKLRGMSFKFVFIDAGHSYWDAKYDFVNWSPMVEVGGEVAFHDCEMETVTWAIEDAVDSNWEEVNHIWRTRVFRRIR